MKYKPYPAYKDSGVEWLGEVPDHWEVKRLKRCLSLMTEKTSRRDYPVALENIESWSGRFIETESEFEGEGVAFAPGDILFGKLRPYLAKAYLAQTNGEAVGDFHVLRPKEEISGRYAQYQILNQDFISIADSSTFGAKMPRVGWEFMANMGFLAAPTSEQIAIATFLDRETAKLDNLIAKQEKLIELLQEKRQALISHVVSKGLNPNVPMMDSGLEWQGETPAHWQAKRLSTVSILQPGKAHEPFVDESGKFICVNSRFVSTGGERRKFCTKNLSPARKGDVLMVMSDLPNGKALAKAFFVEDEDLYAVNQRVCILSIRDGVPRYYFYLLDRHPVLLSHDDGVNQTHLPNAAFSKLELQIPPVDEQAVIATFLDRETAKLDTLIEKSRRSIELMREHRTALISAAVTGKIDVRAHQQAAA